MFVGSEATVAEFLRGRHVALRPVVPDDYPALYAMLHDPEVSQIFRHKVETVAPEQFGTWLWSEVLVQYVVVQTSDPQPIGFVYAYDADRLNGHAKVGFAIRGDLRDMAWPYEGIPLFVDHLFTVFALRKVYMEVIDVAGPSMIEAVSSAFDLEGTLKEHCWAAGSFRDVQVMGVLRENWQLRERDVDATPLLSLLVDPNDDAAPDENPPDEDAAAPGGDGAEQEPGSNLETEPPGFDIETPSWIQSEE